MPPFPSFRLSRRTLLAASIGLGLLLASWLSVGPIARTKLTSAAADRGLEASAGRAWLGFFTVHVRDVHLRARGSDWLDVHLARLEIDLTPWFTVRGVRVDGGEATAVGPLDEMRQRVHDLQGPRAGRTTQAGAGPDVRVSNLRARWSSRTKDDASVEVEGAYLSREHGAAGGATELGAESARYRSRRLTLVVRAPKGRQTGEGGASRWRELGALAAEVQLEAAKQEESEPSAPSAPSPSTVGAITPPAVPRNGALAPPAFPKAGASADRTGAATWRRAKEQLVDAAAWAAEHVTPDALIEVSGLSLRIVHGDQKLDLGPGALKVAVRREAIEVDLMPSSAATKSSSPLRLHAVVPAHAGEVSVGLEGGPVTLASLGVHENDFGLLGVDRATFEGRAHLTLSSDAELLAFRADGSFSNLALVSQKLARDPVQGLELGYRAAGSLRTDGSLVRIDDGELALGAIRLAGSGIVEQGQDFLRVDAHLGVPTSDCQRMFQSLPSALVPRLTGMKLRGAFAWNGAVRLDSRKPEDLSLDWNLENRCRIVEAPANIRVSRFRAPFQHTVYDERNQKVQILSGPGTADWVPLQAISPYLEAAVTTTEDGGFRGHGGFDKGAIKSAIRDDLRAAKFLRGASTITMQVAKNLYLEREKNLSRKLEEAILTVYLEQEMSKDDILELYFNIVEFGPMIYGVGQAAQYYFNTTPYELSLGQALFLSSILPAPKRVYFGGDGQLAKGWASYLRRVMKIMRDRKKISDQELAEGLAEELTLHAARSPHSRFVPVVDEGMAPWLPPDAPGWPGRR